VIVGGPQERTLVVEEKKSKFHSKPVFCTEIRSLSNKRGEMLKSRNNNNKVTKTVSL